MEKHELTHIQDQIHYTFYNTDLLEQAFTRRSYSAENGGENNEVLEFIGDKVLDFFTVKWLIETHSNSSEIFKKFDPQFRNSMLCAFTNPTFPEENYFVCSRDEAELTELKKQLVQKNTLAERMRMLGIADYLLMGNGDVQRNAQKDSSVREDLFEAILGAVAIDSHWDMDKMEQAVLAMLNPRRILENHDENDYVSMIEAWTDIRHGAVPKYHSGKATHTTSCGLLPIGKTQPIIEQDLSPNEDLYWNYTTYAMINIGNDQPIFRGYGRNSDEARQNACKTAYRYLCEKGSWLSIRDEIDNPNPNDAIGQLEILARRHYFSIPCYDFKQSYQPDGNPIWECICHIAEEPISFSSKSSSKKDAKKSAAFQMLQHVLR